MCAIWLILSGIFGALFATSLMSYIIEGWPNPVYIMTPLGASLFSLAIFSIVGMLENIERELEKRNR